MNLRQLFTAAILAVIAAHSFAQEPSPPKHGIKWETLMSLDGKHLSDKKATATLAPSLKRLLGARHKEFMDSIRVQSPIEVENGLAIVSGMLPHSGGDFASLALFSMQGTVVAVIKKEKNLEYFGDKGILENPVAKEAIKKLSN